jgi:hypothetical protein
VNAAYAIATMNAATSGESNHRRTSINAAHYAAPVRRSSAVESMTSRIQAVRMRLAMRTIAVALVALFVAAAASAQQEPPNAPHVPDNGGPARVYFVHSYYATHYNMAGLDDRISIHVQNFSTLLAKANGTCSGITLFFDGMPITGLPPESCDPLAGHIRYRLLRTRKADTAWHTLLGSPHGYSHSVSVSVGADPQFPIGTSVTSFQLEVIPRTQLFLFIGMMALALGVLVRLCRRTGLIRTGAAEVPAAKRPYSLSLFQMAFWFFLVIAAYVFMWLITDELDTITDSVLALIGIGAATAIGSALIDQNKPGAAAAAPPPATVSTSFISDVISDATGVSLHRFQMFVWTLVLGVIFIASVYANLSMPEFSATLLGLMGISSGTYLGMKTAVSRDDAPPAAPTPPPAAPAG